MSCAKVHAVVRSVNTIFFWRLFWLLVAIAFSIFLMAHAPGQTVTRKTLPLDNSDFYGGGAQARDGGFYSASIVQGLPRLTSPAPPGQGSEHPKRVFVRNVLQGNG